LTGRKRGSKIVAAGHPSPVIFCAIRVTRCANNARTDVLVYVTSCMSMPLLLFSVIVSQALEIVRRILHLARDE